MKYVSTRGQAPSLGFEDVLLTGLARDGGLYLPETWPQLTPSQISKMGGCSYEEVALDVMRPFVDEDVDEAALGRIISEAYATFRHRTVAPLVQIGASHWVLELFHGPTLAFKDVAMQVLARLMDRALLRRGQRATIVGATSGDTGGAAIEAFRGRDSIDIFILYPHGRVSDVQRRQMTTPADANVHAVAVDGTFDDCQNIVKALFNDLALRDRLGLAGVNSINWARLVAQIVYYFTSAVALGAPERRVSFTVPTGNFGDIFAGYAAARMGLPIERLVVATNVNDILVRTIETGVYEPKGVVATHSPSMDIQISSNFERLLFETAGRSAERLNEQMAALKSAGRFALHADELGQMRALFEAGRTSEAETIDEIRRLSREAGYVADPHTAVGTAVAQRSARDRRVPMITLATAHPAKFPEAIRQALGEAPVVPEAVRRQAALPERINRMPADQGAIAEFIESHVGRRSAHR
ncbi:MAG: threonine synthase [Hyphomicrobiaceae bacterium]